MKKVAVYDDIAYHIGDNIFIGTDCITVDNQIFDDFSLSREPFIYDVDESVIPDFYLNGYFYFDSTATESPFSIIPEKENQLVEYFNNQLNLSINLELYHENKYNKSYIDANDNLYDTSQEFYNYICDHKLEIENNLNNDLPQYIYKTKLYTGIQLLNYLDKIEEYYEICDNKYNEIRDYIFNTRNSYATLNSVTESDIINKWPQSNQKLNIDGTISEIRENKFTLDISVSKSIISLSSSETTDITFTLLYDNVIYDGADGISWFVPVINIDGNQADLLEIILNNGMGTINWTIDKKGIYTFRMDLVRPKPLAKLPNNIEIIVK